MTNDSEAAVIVVNFGSSELLGRNLEPTVRNSAFHVVVVDNYLDEEERAAVRNLCRQNGWELIAPDQNLGFGTGNNLGVARARAVGARTFALLNPDLSISQEALRDLVSRSQEAPDALLAPMIRRPDGRLYAGGPIVLRLDDCINISQAERQRLPVRARSMEWLSGACLVTSDQLWQASGGFDDEYFLYWEDIDLSRRVVATGGRLTFASDIEAVHDEGGTHRAEDSNDRVKSETYYYYNIRNRFLFAARWLRPEQRGVRWALRTPAAVLSILLQGGRRQFLTSSVPWRSAWRGVRDGRRLLRNLPRMSSAIDLAP